jgi:CRISPR-associated protein Cas6
MMFIDVAFRIIGKEIQLDHSYSLYSALSRQLPLLHEAEWLAVHRIHGLHINSRSLRLTPDSRLKLRMPSEQLPKVLSLAGSRLELVDDDHRFPLRITIPELYVLKPAANLFSPCVVIKLSVAEKENVHPDRQMYLAAMQAKLEKNGITGDVWIDDRGDKDGHEFSRRTIRIKKKIVIGYAIYVTNLSDEDSIKLQEGSMFGRRRFGCGIFSPAVRPVFPGVIGQ